MAKGKLAFGGYAISFKGCKDSLEKVFGSVPIGPSVMTKKIWAYVKKNKLQDTKNRRNINADDKLKEVFGGKKQVSMFEMTKLVSKHLK